MDCLSVSAEQEFEILHRRQCRLHDLTFKKKIKKIFEHTSGNAHTVLFSFSLKNAQNPQHWFNPKFAKSLCKF